MEIDSTPLDVMVLLDDGVPGRVELTGMIDVATRTVPAAVLRPTTKSVDASVLLARTLTPEPMRPGWPASLAMAHSALPYERLLGIDERLRHAAARPVIVPDTIVIDHGSVFVSDNFRSSCRHLGISIQPAHLATGSDKPHIEKMFSSLGTLFCQFAAGYLGRSADRRGRHVDGQPLWSLMQMQDLLDEWLISVWQNRAHEGLRDPLHPQRTFSPNQKYAVADRDGRVRAGPAQRRGPHRAAARSMAGRQRLRHQDQSPDLRRCGAEPDQAAEIRRHGPEGTVGGPPRPLRRVAGVRPRARRLDHLPVELPGGSRSRSGNWPGTTSRGGWPGRAAATPPSERAQAVDDLLRRAYHGPPDDPGTDTAGTTRPRRRASARDRRVAARTRAATAVGSGAPAGRCPAGPEDPAAGQRRADREGDPAGNFQRPRGSEEALVSVPPPPPRLLAPRTTIPGTGSSLSWLAGGGSSARSPPAGTAARTQWRRLGDAGRLAYDEARLNHHSRLLVVATPVIRKVITEGRRLSYLNRNADSGRCGLILSGPARTGKTTAITQLGKTLEVIHRQRHPNSGGDIPVIYITVPPAATAKMIAIEFARFLGLPVIRRANLTDITEAVCGVCADTRTGLVAVDEIHNVSLATRPGAEASDMLKYFSERIPATFVYAGIDVERNGLLSGTRGEQIAGRFGMIRTSAFPRGEYWTGLISALEDSLRLHRHQPGALTGLKEYLHRRTGGMIGSLLRLIRGAAIQAVLDGTEQITRTSLDSIGVDIASETADTGRRRPGAPRGDT